MGIELENKSTRKTFCRDAIKKVGTDTHVIISIAKIFWKEKKYNKARLWFKEKAIVQSPDLGDAWIYYYAFEVDVETKKT